MSKSRVAVVAAVAEVAAAAVAATVGGQLYKEEEEEVEEECFDNHGTFLNQGEGLCTRSIFRGGA